MLKITCSNCGNENKTGYKFCLFCGSSLEGHDVEQRSKIFDSEIPSSFERNTFFCPKCMHENIIDNYSCSNCGEDFEKYDISTSIQEHTKKRAQQEEIRRSFFWGLLNPCY